MSRIVVALGGNALGNTPDEQINQIRNVIPSLVDLMSEGHEVVITHGNGPQVGQINLSFENSAGTETTKDIIAKNINIKTGKCSIVIPQFF